MPKVKDFRGLVRWLVTTRHGGVVDHMAERVGISSALAWKWNRGRVRKPSVDSLLMLCAAYPEDVEFLEVMHLVHGNAMNGITLPSPTFATPGPPIPPPIGGGSGNDEAPPLASVRDVFLLIGHLARTWAQVLGAWLGSPTRLIRPLGA